MTKSSIIVEIERTWEKKLKGIGILGPEVDINASLKGFDVKVSYQALDMNNPNGKIISQNPTEFISKLEIKIYEDLKVRFPLSISNIADNTKKFIAKPKEVLTTAISNRWDEINPLNAYNKLKEDFIATGVAIGKGAVYLEKEFRKKYGEAPISSIGAPISAAGKKVIVRGEQLKTKLKREARQIQADLQSLTRNSEAWLDKVAQYYHIMGLLEGGAKKHWDKEKAALQKLEALRSVKKQDYPIPQKLSKPLPVPNIQQFLDKTPEEYPVPARLAGKEKLPDTVAWANRYAVTSSKSGNTYVVAQNKKNGTWGCSCKRWIFKRTCPHLTELGLS